MAQASVAIIKKQDQKEVQWRQQQQQMSVKWVVKQPSYSLWTKLDLYEVALYPLFHMRGISDSWHSSEFRHKVNIISLNFHKPVSFENIMPIITNIQTIDPFTLTIQPMLLVIFRGFFRAASVKRQILQLIVMIILIRHRYRQQLICIIILRQQKLIIRSCL